MLIALREGKASLLTPLLVALHLLVVFLPCSATAFDNSGHCASIPSETQPSIEPAVAHAGRLNNDDVVDDEAPVRNCCMAMCAQFIPVALPAPVVEIRPSIKAKPRIEPRVVGTAPKRLIRPSISSVSL